MSDPMSYHLALMQAKRELARQLWGAGPVPAEADRETPRWHGAALAALRWRVGQGLIRAGRTLAGSAEPAHRVQTAGDACQG